ncbi:MAG: thiosulfohydrolase SoxB [Litorivicinaceae bacterium]|jgi:S-sulfosulfanyl-L-cysteine sulfohydrolase|nr:thiosulfohydrolase SoxB [Litorivicinaceae bacterium]MDP5331412.1 thiosulfohydrolase SoxB [Litorivicinaceae bacterium]MDP5340113.1 thiosulfohydrolase SoxB [Litorivicinaceae bacterium]MDP5344330.1 thiosulfohydrolase SoxB [Litorivicinaceae bacterium]MDP5363036.1 thiosulfohydrolase SoxB [Litorivicinaceae bacterium]
MSLSRREFGQILSLAAAGSMLPLTSRAESAIFDTTPFGQVRLMHITDCHAQLNPIYFREPNVNLGLYDAKGRPPHVVGASLLAEFGIKAGSPEAHAFTYLGFQEAARRFGKVGGFAHLKTLVDRLRGEYGREQTLLMDGGDTWQGSATSLWTRGQDMVDACNLLGVDVMTGHWEFTYLEDEIRANLERFQGEFVAQNVKVSEDALFEGAEAFDEDSGHAFKPYTIREMKGFRVAVIGQSFPYTPIANPARFIPNWTFGIRDGEMQELVNQVRADHQPHAVIVLSHNGMDVDIKMAEVVSGIDVIFGGHTHDAVPAPVAVNNAGGTTLVTNAGSNGKFLGVMDLELSEQGVKGYRYRLLPVFANLLDADSGMTQLITEIRAPYATQLNEELAVADELLYRRGNFNGTFDQVICDALRVQLNAQISLSPGFRWGTTVLPGDAITFDNVMDQTAITYPETYVRPMTGAEIKLILEDVCDNLFNADPFYQQGGDMVRVGGLDYVVNPMAEIGSRISEMRLDDGSVVEAGKSYLVAGWATVGSQSIGPHIYDVVADYLRDQKTIRIQKLNSPVIRGIGSNPGLANYLS